MWNDLIVSLTKVILVKDPVLSVQKIFRNKIVQEL